MINFVCALACEAKPLIQYYGLRGIGDTVFRLYEKNEIRLVVTGIGKINAAAACSYMFAYFGEQKNQVWLNVGVAGHAHAIPGNLFLVNKSHDVASGINYFPSLIANNFASAPLITVDRVEERFKENTLYDMEASAFFAIANRFASAELVGSAKIVSDNKAMGSDHVDETYVSQLLQSSIADIVAVVQQYQQLQTQFAAIYKVPKLCETLAALYRFSAYEEKSLQKLLRRWVQFFPEDELLLCAKTQCASAKSLLQFMKDKLAQAEFEY